MAAHRYWRLLLVKTHSAIDFGFDEIDLRESAAGPRLSVTGAVTLTASDTIASGGYTLAGIIDGIPYTNDPADNAHGWYSTTAANYNKWIVFDFGFGFAYDINFIAITNVGPSGSAALYSMKIGVLQWSDDNTNWTNHIYISDNPNTAGTRTEFEYAPLAIRLNSTDHLYEQTVPYTLHTTLSQAYRGTIYGAGQAWISGNVKIDGTPTDTPVRRRVVLFREPEMLVVGDTVSDKDTGYFAFYGIDPNAKYMVVAMDNTHSYRAVLADNVTPERMT